MIIKKDLDDKTKRSLIKNIIIELNKNFKDYDFFIKRKKLILNYNTNKYYK